MVGRNLGKGNKPDRLRHEEWGTMPKGNALNEQERLADEREHEKKGEAKRGTRTGLVTAILRHYATCSDLKLGGVCKERHR